MIYNLKLFIQKVEFIFSKKNCLTRISIIRSFPYSDNWKVGKIQREGQRTPPCCDHFTIHLFPDLISFLVKNLREPHHGHHDTEINFALLLDQYSFEQLDFRSTSCLALTDLHLYGKPFYLCDKGSRTYRLSVVSSSFFFSLLILNRGTSYCVHKKRQKIPVRTNSSHIPFDLTQFTIVLCREENFRELTIF